jgi:hypothetical protein
MVTNCNHLSSSSVEHADNSNILTLVGSQLCHWRRLQFVTRFHGTCRSWVVLCQYRNIHIWVRSLTFDVHQTLFKENHQTLLLAMIVLGQTKMAKSIFGKKTVFVRTSINSIEGIKSHVTDDLKIAQWSKQSCRLFGQGLLGLFALGNKGSHCDYVQHFTPLSRQDLPSPAVILG